MELYIADGNSSQPAKISASDVVMWLCRMSDALRDYRDGIRENDADAMGDAALEMAGVAAVLQDIANGTQEMAV